ncbi:MAG: NAD(P)H-dependent oxidoreductase [Firmicutes bacterium]|nr:NAD(P)H-dependent oxidoreductase [Bacillota bacterium]
MKKILFVDASVREESRTRELAVHLVRKLRGEVETVRLIDEELPVLDERLLAWRNDACEKGDYDSKYFRYANQFKEADYIVVAAPYWDLSFPAALKNYVENITINGLTFKYDEEGHPVGLCKGSKLYYVTTSGGSFLFPEFSSGYLKAMACGMFGVADFACIAAENLDVIGTDVDKVMAEAKAVIDEQIPY